MKVSTGVFERKGGDTISANGFYGTLTASLVWGLVLTAFIAHKVAEMHFVPGLGEIILIGLVVPIAGVFIAVKSTNPFGSFIGYNMIVVPFGIILGPVLNHYTPDIVRNAFGMTAVIALFMGTAGTLFPGIFARMGSALFFALLGLVGVSIARIFIPAIDLTIIDYAGAGIFSLYIGYDMYRANHIPKTVDNAIDVSVNLYLDIINLFLFVLRIFGRRS